MPPRALGLLLAMTFLPGCAAHVAPPPPDGTVAAPCRAKEMRIEVNRVVGLVPLEIRIDGILLDDEHKEMQPTEEERVRLQVETSHYRIVGGDRSNPFYRAGVDEIDAAGIKNPMVRELRITRQGTYHFSLIWTDEEGNEIQSNTVTVKGM